MKDKTQGILVGKKNYSESSLILSFYTKNQGLVSFIFKGAKKKQAAIFYLEIYELSYFLRPESNLGIIQTMNKVVVLTEIFLNPRKLIMSFFLTDILRKSLKEEQPDSAIYEFLKNQILVLESQENLLFFPLVFLLNYIKLLGFSPIVDSTQSSDFDSKLSRVTLSQSEHDEKAVKLMRDLLNQKTVEIDQKTTQNALILLLDYYKKHLPNFNIDSSLQIIRETLYD